MQTNAYAHSDPLRPGMSEERALHGHGCCHSIAGTGKYHEKRVSLRIDFVAMVLREGAPQQVATVGQHAGVALAQLLQEARRAFHIAEEQRERSSR